MKNILVIRLGAIGDVLLTSAPVLNLKLSYPESRIYFLTRERTASLVRCFAGVDDVITLPQKITLLQLYHTAEQLDRIGFDLVCDLHGNIRSQFITRYISAPYKTQYPKRRLERMAAVKRHRIIDNPPHAIDLYDQAVEAVGGDVYCRRPVLHLPPDSNDSHGTVTDSLPLIAIAPGASYPAKQWPADRFRELVRRIIGDNIGTVLLLLSSSDSAMLDLASEFPEEKLRILLDADLITVAREITRAEILISNDSGLMHLGSSVGTPVLALFGPTHPTLGFTPRGLQDRVLEVEEYCRPCSLHGQKACHRETQYCFTRIEVNDVMDNLQKMLAGNSKGEKALFVDRDGTLIKEKYFISTPSDVEPETRAVDAIRAVRRAGYKIIVLSNQSGVARGFFDELSVQAVNTRVMRLFADQDAPLDDILYCPYYKKGTVAGYARHSTDRKPGSGMVETAARRHNINPHLSYVVGDKLTDCALAYVVGANGILVRTGYGRQQESLIDRQYAFWPEKIVENLGEAVDYIVRGGQGSYP
ncbi:MAG: HAD-IIIA family hydrolase [candidate division Zixibacteria bacterium]|nr:HAD-IIIA family hydrolase [candidate division Zixibacteria bacterium]